MHESRSIIDPNIDLEESIRALNPAETSCLLSLAFLLKSCAKYSSFLKDWRLTPGSLTNFSQVSQHWRSSALSAPELWTNIPFNCHRWAQEMLIRSKKANLTLTMKLQSYSYRFFKETDPKVIETVRSCPYEMDRVEKIDFRAILGRTLEEYFRNCPKSAPQLIHCVFLPKEKHFRSMTTSSTTQNSCEMLS